MNWYEGRTAHPRLAGMCMRGTRRGHKYTRVPPRGTEPRTLSRTRRENVACSRLRDAHSKQRRHGCCLTTRVLGGVALATLEDPVRTRGRFSTQQHTCWRVLNATPPHQTPRENVACSRGRRWGRRGPLQGSLGNYGSHTTKPRSYLRENVACSRRQRRGLGGEWRTLPPGGTEQHPNPSNNAPHHTRRTREPRQLQRGKGRGNRTVTAGGSAHRRTATRRLTTAKRGGQNGGGSGSVTELRMNSHFDYTDGSTTHPVYLTHLQVYSPAPAGYHCLSPHGHHHSSARAVRKELERMTRRTEVNPDLQYAVV